MVLDSIPLLGLLLRDMEAGFASFEFASSVGVASDADTVVAESGATGGFATVAAAVGISMVAAVGVAWEEGGRFGSLTEICSRLLP